MAPPSYDVYTDLSLVDTKIPPRIAAIFAIFFVSLFAVSFASISKRSSFIRIPHIVFTVGRHFGTGVILSTAFCHLLQDAFEHLQNPILKREYPGVGKQTGLIILSSLLLIFFVEYISSSYVSLLHAEPSAPPSPAAPASPSHSPQRSTVLLPAQGLPTETTPLISPSLGRRLSVIAPHTPTVLHSHHHSLSRPDGRVLSIFVTTASPEPMSYSATEELAEPEGQEAPDIGRRRQIVGLLVLELGILLHSLVIGLTLALTTGGDFTSLLTAVIFHQLFEGLSLGIRIASLPASPNAPRVDWFSVTLSLLFALTTPTGLTVGVLAFSKHARLQPSTLLIKGVMSAVSAGMLIYAATVEMIAADFVYGSLEDDHGHSHGMPEDATGHDNDEKKEGVRPSAMKRALALGSLLAGVGSMVLVSLGE
ncbi:Zinc/iron permease [Mycena rebaudengoi]|nr:Zinc/iron permease [Mycena rebaudengoi]